MAAGHGALWVVTSAVDPSRPLEKRDPVSGALLATLPILPGPLAPGPTGMWLAYGTWEAPYLERIDPATVTVADRFELAAESVPGTLVPTAAPVWLVYDRSEDAVVAVDPATGDQQPVDLPTTPDSLAPSPDGGVWTVHLRERVVRRLAPTGEVVHVIDLPDG